MKFSEKNLEDLQKYTTMNRENNVLIAEDMLVEERNFAESAEIIQYNILLSHIKI